MKKRILIYAHYYPPDVASTGQILQDLAEGMSKDFDVTVICTVPSYTGVIPEEYRKKRIYEEELNGVKLLRVPVPPFSKRSKSSRIKNLLAYYLEAQKATKKVGNQDFVFTISQPPIMGGMLGVYGKNKIRTANGQKPKLIYNIQDFNPEQIEAVGYFKNRAVIELMRWMDKCSCRKSDLVITVGRDLVETLKKRFTGEMVPNHVMINNWIDEKEIYPLPADDSGVLEFKRKYGLENKFIFMYSGNIGLYYDLDGLIKVIGKFKDAKAADGRDVVFAFVGAGSMLEKLKQYKAENDIENVVFIPYQPKDKLVYSLNSADVHLCVNAKGIKGVSCPSKFYGIAGVGKPVLAVLEKSSEIGMLINDIGCGIVSEPGDYEQFENNISWFIKKSNALVLQKMAFQGHNYLKRNLTKDISVSKYIKELNSLEKITESFGFIEYEGTSY